MDIFIIFYNSCNNSIISLQSNLLLSSCFPWNEVTVYQKGLSCWLTLNSKSHRGTNTWGGANFKLPNFCKECNFSLFNFECSLCYLFFCILYDWNINKSSIISMIEEYKIQNWSNQNKLLSYSLYVGFKHNWCVTTVNRKFQKEIYRSLVS